MRRVCAKAAALIAIALFLDGTLHAESGPTSLNEAALPKISGTELFPMDSKLEPRVRFWVNIYARYHSWETLLVDIRNPQVVFSIVNTKERPGVLALEKRKLSLHLRSLSEKWSAIEQGKLRRSSLKGPELALLEVFEKAGLQKEIRSIGQDPAKRIRAQNGLRDTLEDSLFVSGKYLPRIEALFSRFSLPTEIAYLPFVESGFNKHAVSKVGASGIWQFMPYTGKLYLRIDDVVDERNDPMRAAEAAARLMKQNYDVLGDWPLAITAYNHGTTGVARVAREVGSRQISELIEKVENKNFGFASQNFYACFLAAMHVARNADSYLGMVPRANKLEFDEFVMPDYMNIKEFLSHMEIEESLFRDLNPALTEEVYSGAKLIPVGYIVRVPVESSAAFLLRYEAIPAPIKFRYQRNQEEPVSIAGGKNERAPASGEVSNSATASPGN